MKPMIPSMGGREMGPVYRRFIDDMPLGMDVVEVGAWLGAGTYEMASAMAERHNKSTLHVYDWFIATHQCIDKAAGKHKYRQGITVDGLGDPIKLKTGQDTLPIVRGFLHPFPNVKFYKGNIDHLKYNGGKIGMLVVDAAKRGSKFRKLMGKLEPHMVAGAVVVFMDYYFHLYKKDSGTQCQEDYVKKSGKYTMIESHQSLCAAVFKYEN